MCVNTVGYKKFTLGIFVSKCQILEECRSGCMNQSENLVKARAILNLLSIISFKQWQCNCHERVIGNGLKRLVMISW
jgi:hypothetical protein